MLGKQPKQHSKRYRTTMTRKDITFVHLSKFTEKYTHALD